MFNESTPGYPLSLQALFMEEDDGMLITLMVCIKLTYPTVSKNFQALLQIYNNLVSFTSLGARLEKSVQGHYRINVFCIKGGLTHMI